MPGGSQQGHGTPHTGARDVRPFPRPHPRSVVRRSAKAHHGAEPGHRCDRVLEHLVHGQSHRPPATAGPSAGPEPAQARLAFGLGSHRPDRRLRLELRRRATHQRVAPQSLSDAAFDHHARYRNIGFRHRRFLSPLHQSRAAREPGRTTPCPFATHGIDTCAAPSHSRPTPRIAEFGSTVAAQPSQTRSQAPATIGFPSLASFTFAARAAARLRPTAPAAWRLRAGAGTPCRPPASP